MKYTKEQLCKIAEQYFEKPEIEMMYATEDNNFFYESNSGYARSHARTNNLELFKITREDVYPTIEKAERPSKRFDLKEVKEEVKDDLKVEDKEPKIEEVKEEVKEEKKAKKKVTKKKTKK